MDLPHFLKVCIVFNSITRFYHTFFKQFIIDGRVGYFQLEAILLKKIVFLPHRAGILWDLSSLTRDQIQALGMESQPLDCQGIPEAILNNAAFTAEN